MFLNDLVANLNALSFQQVCQRTMNINLLFNFSFPGCCGCCQALRPRYKRLVDNIFPVLPQDGLVKNAMERLIFYAVSSPEKLDRIGEYLYQKAGRDIYRRRYK